ncbi:30S ribosome-binding factor RbfA [Apibacter muscae]|uniref:30S ribosome-binding factor RbfA n=1 Tax=Apibacter muscae TaxID=2509004 RepID=UPI0011AD9F0A|nr:30S ribosome-binding factor RbfA [Apibacter muscae]TWP24014.1 30S ribosome-binding factor RbfA [Apibacter muscae]
MDSNRQRKVNQLLQEELAEIFRQQSANIGKNLLISVTEVKVSVDLSTAKVYLSIFPPEKRSDLIEEIGIVKSQIRKILGLKLAKQLRRIPELIFRLDTTLDDIEKINKALKDGDENNILNK